MTHDSTRHRPGASRPSDRTPDIDELFESLATAINARAPYLNARADLTNPEMPTVRLYDSATGDLADIVTYDLVHSLYRWGPNHQHTYPVSDWGRERSLVVEHILATAGRDVISVTQIREWLCGDMLGAPVMDSQVDGVEEAPPDRFWIDLANGQTFKVTVTEVLK